MGYWDKTLYPSYDPVAGTEVIEVSELHHRIMVSAFLLFRGRNPGVKGHIEVSLHLQEKHVKVEGQGITEVYSFKDLGV